MGGFVVKAAPDKDEYVYYSDNVGSPTTPVCSRRAMAALMVYRGYADDREEAEERIARADFNGSSMRIPVGWWDSRGFSLLNRSARRRHLFQWADKYPDLVGGTREEVEAWAVDPPDGYMVVHCRATDTLYFGPFKTLDAVDEWCAKNPQVLAGIVPLYLTVDWNRRG